MTQPTIDTFPLRAFDKVSYADTDRQGHVNNAVFPTFLETGRVEFLYNKALPILSDGASFVIASLNLNFLDEIMWPGHVEIGTGILKVGNSSIRIFQQLFQDGKCVADAETVIVQVDNASSRGMPLSSEAKDLLGQWMLPNSGE